MAKRRRPYQSAVRAAHADSTRARIIDAAYERLKTTRPVDLSFADVAADAEVAVRTVYRHFPTADDLFRAVSGKLLGSIGLAAPDAVTSIAQLNESLVEMWTLLERDPAVFRLLFAVPSRSASAHVFENAFTGELRQLSSDDRSAALALIELLTSPYAWDVMHHNYGLPLERSLRAVHVGVQAVLDYLKKHPGALSPKHPPPKLLTKGATT